MNQALKTARSNSIHQDLVDGIVTVRTTQSEFANATVQATEAWITRG